MIPEDVAPLHFMAPILQMMEEDVNEQPLYQRKRLWKWYTRYIRYAMEKLIWIRTQDAELLPFRLNRIQRKYLAKRLWDQFVRRVPCRYIIGPKPRRIGATTVVSIDQHIITKYTPHFPALVIAHNSDATRMIFDWHKMYEDYIDAQAMAEYEKMGQKAAWRSHPSVMPIARRNDNLLRWKDWLGGMNFAEEGGSFIRVATGGNVKGAMGDGFRFIHYSELGVDDVDWDAICKSNDIMCPARDRFGKPSVGTTIIKEGATYLDDTSRVLTGVYLQNIIQAVYDGESEFEHMFFPWYEMERYREPLDPGEKVKPFGAGIDSKRRDAEELDDTRALMWQDWEIDKYTGPQRERLVQQMEECLNYRQKVIMPSMDGNLDWVHSQYPKVWKEAFVSRAQKFFAGVDVNNLIEHLGANPPKVHIDSDLGVTYKDPERGMKYLIVSDHSSGSGQDAFAAWVFNTKDLSIDAVAHGNVEINEQTSTCVDLCHRFAERDVKGEFIAPALWVPEANNHGQECINVAWRDLEFRNIWRRKPLDPRKGSQDRGKLGFWSGEDKRQEALEHLLEQWKTWEIPDIRIAREFNNFGYVKKSVKPQAVLGGDEFVTLGWITAYVCRVLGYVKARDWREFWVEPVHKMSDDDIDATLDHLDNQLHIAQEDEGRGIEGAATRKNKIQTRMNELVAQKVAIVNKKEPNRAWAEMLRNGGVHKHNGDIRMRGLKPRRAPIRR